jgi:hypothetical protein
MELQTFFIIKLQHEWVNKIKNNLIKWKAFNKLNSNKHAKQNTIEKKHIKMNMGFGTILLQFSYD